MPKSLYLWAMDDSNPMSTYNRVEIRGHVGAMPFVKYTGPTTCIARFSVATNRMGYTDEEGRSVVGEVTEWHSIVCFNATAQQVERDVRTGATVEVSGRLSYEEVRLPSGERTKSARVEADRVRILRYREEVAGKSGTKPEEITNPYGKYLDTLSHDVGDSGLPF